MISGKMNFRLLTITLEFILLKVHKKIGIKSFTFCEFLNLRIKVIKLCLNTFGILEWMKKWCIVRRNWGPMKSQQWMKNRELKTLKSDDLFTFMFLRALRTSWSVILVSRLRLWCWVMIVHVGISCYILRLESWSLNKEE